MTSSLTFLITGFLLGLSGLIPGPLFTLVVTETLRHNIKEGIKVAASPLITDLPIVLVTILILSRLSEQQTVLGIISFAGSAFLLYLAFESVSFKGTEIDPGETRSRSLEKGIITNFLNPSPYIFWFSIGAPTFVRAMDLGIAYAILFIISFYTTLIGSMIIIAIITYKSRNFLSSRYYINLIRSLGVVLLIFAVIFLRNGIKYMDSL